MLEELFRNNSSLQGYESQHTAKVRETSVNQGSASHTFTQAVMEELAAVPACFSVSIDHQSSLQGRKCPTSSLGGVPPASSSSWLPVCLTGDLPRGAQELPKGKSPCL